MGSQCGNDLVQQHGMWFVAGFQHHVGQGIDRLAHGGKPLQGAAHVVIVQQGACLIVFLALYFLFLWVSWVLAVRMTRPKVAEQPAT